MSRFAGDENDDEELFMQTRSKHVIKLEAATKTKLWNYFLTRILQIVQVYSTSRLGHLKNIPVYHQKPSKIQ